MLLTTSNSLKLLKQIFGMGNGASSGEMNKIEIGTLQNCWLGVFTSDPVASETFTEPDASHNYARVNIYNLMSTTFGSGSGQVPINPDYTYPDANAEARRIGNFADINFNCAYLVSDESAVSGGEWGTIKGWGLFSNATLTNHSPYAYGKLLEDVIVGHKNTLHFLKGRFVVYMDDAGNTAAAAQASV